MPRATLPDGAWLRRLDEREALLGAVLATYLLQLAVIYVPALNPVFKTEPLELDELLFCTFAPSPVFFAVEFEKWPVRRRWIYRD